MGWRIEKPREDEPAAGAPEPSDVQETATYIGRMAAELRVLATKAGLPFLAYLLTMAEDEALSGKPDR